MGVTLLSPALHAHTHSLCLHLHPVPQKPTLLPTPPTALHPPRAQPWPYLHQMQGDWSLIIESQNVLGGKVQRSSPLQSNPAAVSRNIFN